jgi:hypothetical protein
VKKAGWIEVGTSPWYVGDYEVRNGQSKAERATFSPSGWSRDGFTHWRGRVVSLESQQRKRYAQIVDLHRGASKTRKTTGRAARKLARHYAVGVRARPARVALYYEIASILAARLTPADRRAWDLAAAALSEKERGGIARRAARWQAPATLSDQFIG